MQKVRRSAKEVTIITACLFGVGLAILTSVLFAMLIAAMISGEYIELNFSQYTAPLAIFIAVTLGSLTAAKLVDKKRAQVCIAVSGVFVLLQCCVALLFFDGISSAFFVGFISCLVACAVSVFLSVAEKKRAKSLRNRKRNR